MKLFKILIGLVGSIVALPSLAASVHTFSTCQLNEGKTGADAAAFIETQTAYYENGSGVDGEWEILWPFFGNERPQGTFILHRVSENFKDLGTGLNWTWDQKNFEAEDNPVNDVFYCKQNQVLWKYEAAEA